MTDPPSVGVVREELLAMLQAFRRHEAARGSAGERAALEALVQSALAFAETHKAWRQQKRTNGQGGFGAADGSEVSAL